MDYELERRKVHMSAIRLVKRLVMMTVVSMMLQQEKH